MNKACPIYHNKDWNKKTPLSEIVHYSDKPLPDEVVDDWYRVRLNKLYCRNKSSYYGTSRWSCCWSRVTCQQCLKMALKRNWSKLRPILMEFTYATQKIN